MEHVYFLQIQDWPDGDGPVKIGRTSRDVEVRYREWQCGMPFHNLKFLGKKKGGSRLEAKLKRIFSEHSIVPPQSTITRTEWFWPTPKLMKYIKEKAQD